MRTHLTRLRGALVLLLVGSACLFAVGSTIERHQRHHESNAAKAAEVSKGESGGESGSESGNGEPVQHVEKSHGEAGATILGVNTESVALTVVAVILSLLLAAAIWLVRSQLVLLAVAGFGLVFAAGDIRELVHQLNESHAGIAAIAAVLIVLHLAVAAVAALLVARAGPGAAPALDPTS